MVNQTLPKYDLQALADSLAAIFDGSENWLRIMKLLLEGHPLSPEQVASALQISRDEVNRLLEGAEFDPAGNVVGLGLSLVPTPHAYQVNGRQFYVWCAGDAITLSIILKTTAVIESPDPISGEKVRLIATPEGVQQVEPVTSVVTWVSETGELKEVRSWGCNFIHFFTSVESASRYVAQHPGLIIVPMDEVFQMGKLLWEREPFKSVIENP